MVNCVTVLKSALVALVLVVAVVSGQTAEKLSDCCTRVSTRKPIDPIIGYRFQRAQAPCVPAVIFQTEKRKYCTYVKAPWVLSTIKELNAKAQIAASTAAPTSPVSLLSIITSTASPPTPSTTPAPSSSSPSSPPPFSSTSEMPQE
ncbi:hypothetical protein D9C73_021545 [Collichthys lucidus]|uniref:Chemokine interleukin-8-like domain-containing protein n=1 Tax=Collichthys lucidus TaxID=240159 RepID=A0A4U5VI01_COLLU|nr:hypothetical protein D9C73_021545 [Collichthys lucidus]